jgi:hypothetical protein
MRLEPNISVRAIQSTEYKVQSSNDKDSETRHPELDSGSSSRIDPKDLPKFKVEVKNINSFNFVKKAVDYEVKRQGEMLDKGETPAQETRGWDEKKNVRNLRLAVERDWHFCRRSKAGGLYLRPAKKPVLVQLEYLAAICLFRREYQCPGSKRLA